MPGGQPTQACPAAQGQFPEPLAVMLRAGNADSNTGADHIEATPLALAQLPIHLRHRT